MATEPNTAPTTTEQPPAPSRDAISVTTEDDDSRVVVAETALEQASRSHVVTEEPGSEAVEATSEQEPQPADGPNDEDDGDDDGEPEPAAAQASDAAAPDGQSTTDADGSGDEGKPKSRRARKVARLQRELAAANERVAALEASTQEPSPAKTEATEPEADDFGSWDEYAEAKAVWLASQKEPADAPGPRRDLPASWGEVSDKYSDFDEVIRGPHPVTAAMTDVMIDMAEEGAEAAYYLGQHPDEAKRIASLSGNVAITRELTKLAALAAADTGTPTGNGTNPDKGGAANVAPKVSTAPTPITRPEGGGAQARTVDLNTADPETYRAQRRRQMAGEA